MSISSEWGVLGPWVKRVAMGMKKNKRTKQERAELDEAARMMGALEIIMDEEDDSFINKSWSAKELRGKATEWLRRGRYRRAMMVFKLLVQVDPRSWDHWLRVGLDAQNKKEYDLALAAFGLAALADVNCPEPHVQAAECYAYQGKEEQARQSLKIGIEYARLNKKYSRVLDRAMRLGRKIREGRITPVDVDERRVSKENLVRLKSNKQKGK